MKKLRLFLALLLAASSAEASFEPLSVGAREAGMGDAVTAMVDDVYASYYNPAGLAHLRRPELGAYYSRLFVGLSDNSQISRGFVGYAQPLGTQGKYGTLAANYITLLLPGLYEEETYGLSYARSLGPRWNLGGTIKLLRKTIGSDEYTNNAINPLTTTSSGQTDPLLSNGRSVSQPAMDLGLQYRLTDKLVLGAVSRNLNEPNMSLGNDTDPAPRYTALGLARKTRESAVSIEVGEYKSVQNQYQISFGGERWLGDVVALRAGYGYGSLDYSMVTVGASFRFNGFQLDYSMNYPVQGVGGTAGDQQIDFTIRFGKPPIDPDELRLLQERQRRLEAEGKALSAEAERNSLKAQMDELTEMQKSQLPVPAPQTVIEEKPAPTQAEAKTTLAWYLSALESYNNQVRDGATLMARQGTVRAIIVKFNGKVDLSVVEKENAVLGEQIDKAKADYLLTLKYYEEFVKEGANLNERKIMLQKVLLKFAPTGFDMSPIEEELRSIQKLSASADR